MGAGRKTETYTLASDGYGSMSVRNLKKGDLCGVIFGCKFSTIKECFAKKLFGLPSPHMAYIKNIDPGLTLFLFNYSDRTLHGIFEAASEGKLNIDPKAWSPNGTDPTPYPAQVKVRARMRCEPLSEEKFKPAIAENYRDEKIFLFELDRCQTNKLLRMFSPSPSVKAASSSKDAAPPPRNPIPASSLSQIADLGVPRVDKWSSLFKSADESSKNKEKELKEGAHTESSRLVSLGKTKGWETSFNNADERRTQSSVSQSGASYSSIVRNNTNEVSSQACKGVENPWASASRVQSLRQDSERFSSKEVEDVKVNAYHHHQQQILHPTPVGTSTKANNNIIGDSIISKEDSAEDIFTDINWDESSSFQAHLDGLNKILEDPKDKEFFMRAASSSMVPNCWEDEKVSSDLEERSVAKSPYGSSYFSALEVVDEIENGSPNLVEILSEILSEVKELKNNQMKQEERMITLEMGLLESRREILRLKGSKGKF